MNRNANPILIVGATGLIGSRTARVLLGRGQPVRALVRNPGQARWLEQLGAELAVGNLDDPASLERALAGVDSALLVSNLTPEQTKLQGNFAAAAARSGRPHVVKVSGFLTALNSPARSGRWHAETEAAIMAADLPWTFLRAPFFMQNLLRTEPHAVSNRELALPLDTARVAIVDARDIADVAAGALGSAEHVGQTYLVTGPEAVTFREVAERLARYTGRDIRYRLTTEEETRAMLAEAGAPQWRRELVMEFYAGFNNGLGSEVTDAVERVAGHPSTTLESFLRSEGVPADDA